MQRFDGLLLVNKPAGISSVDVLRHLKRVLPREVKMGHAGTLDPFATGLLIVCFGRGTRLVPFLTDVTKGYRVVALFGRRTDTLDGTGKIMEEQPVPDDLVLLLPRAVELLGAVYKQIPPIFSALKHEGVPLYTLARYQKISESELMALVAAKARWVLIYQLAIESVLGAAVTFSCEVSKGAYIRTLANDLAQKIGLYATTLQLERTFIGPFFLKEAQSLDALNSIQAIANYVIETEKARTLLA